MPERLYRTGLAQGREIWPILGLLLLALMVPTVCLLWFMTEAVRNERMAVQQKITELYSSNLKSLQPEIDEFWEQKGKELLRVCEAGSPDRAFLTIVEKGMGESVVIFDGEGKPAYPSDDAPSPMPPTAITDRWSQAESLEYAHKDYSAAAEVYAEVAAQASEAATSVPALRARIRCLVKAGKRNEAIGAIKEIIRHPEYGDIRDRHARLMVPDLQLNLLTLVRGTEEGDFNEVKDALAGRLRDYDKPSMPSSQRLFLMEELRAMAGDIEFSSLTGERLAHRYLDLKLPLPAAEGLSRVPQSDLWQMPLAGRRAVVLFSVERIISEMQAVIDKHGSLPDARIYPTMKNDLVEPAPFLSVTAGSYLPDFKVNLLLNKNDLFAVASERRIAVYVWTAILVIGILSVLTILAVRLLLRQVRLTRLKNDIVATVSHELKTPLSSMRMLVDTLLDGRYGDKAFVKDYLELISKENDRLSRMIENFLTFSRMERKKYNFVFHEVDPACIAATACESVKQRFDAGGFTLTLDVSPEMPIIAADRDALIIVLLNLLDNAYTYAYDGKQVAVRLASDHKNVYFEVKDNGIGLTQKEIKKILDPFYQADQRLSRHGKGCGLGLSIVKSIVDAHDGSINIMSERGNGSVFVVMIPIKHP